MSWKRVSLLDPEHLFQQARKLIGPAPIPDPWQENLRRAVSAAYYSVFHTALTAAADMVVGQTDGTGGLYELVYRSVTHTWLRDLCQDIRKRPMPHRYRRYEPEGGFGQDMTTFAEIVIQLQEARNEADYSPSLEMSRSETIILLSRTRTAFYHFNTAPASDRKAFLILLLFQPRKN
jgi:hypothetical protein